MSHHLNDVFVGVIGLTQVFDVIFTYLRTLGDDFQRKFKCRIALWIVGLAFFGCSHFFCAGTSFLT